MKTDLSLQFEVQEVVINLNEIRTYFVRFTLLFSLGLFAHTLFRQVDN